MKRFEGFTIIELMVVIAITGILLGIGAPTFATWLRNVQIRNAAESLQNGLHFARMEALRRNERVSFWMVASTSAKILDNSCTRSGSGTSWVVSRDDPASLCGVAVSETVAPRIYEKKAGAEGSSEISVTAVNSGNTAASCITFNGFGRAEAKCADTALSDRLTQLEIVTSTTDVNTRKLQVRVSSGGVIRMCDPSPSVSSTDPRYC